jgi:FixJ family two-component response regulator
MSGEHRSDVPVVILIGDDATFRETLSRLCQSVGLNVLVYDSLAQFLAMKCPDAPACLVIDVSSPSLGRAKFHAQLTRADVQIPIVPVTGAGAVEILTRRIRDQSMLATIEIALQMDRARREGSKRVTPN